MEFSHSPSKGKETKKKREKLKKRNERKRNDKWKESKAKKKIAFCKYVRNDSEPSSRLVNKALSYVFVEKPENGFSTKCSGVEITTKLKTDLWTYP